MPDLTYHLEEENRGGKKYLAVCVVSALGRKLTKENLIASCIASGEKGALEILLKEHARIAPKDSLERLLVSSARSFEVLKLLGTTGRLFYKGKKIIVDPFTSVNREPHCDLFFEADPSWMLFSGVIRTVNEEVELLPEVVLIDPSPFLILADRHGGFANLWFDYGSFGKVAAYDPSRSPFRNLEAEKGWEKDLLETDFIKKIVDRSHFYCPLDKVAKSLTFLLEIGWTIIDSNQRMVVRQKQVDFDVAISDKTMLVKAKVNYGDHEIDLKDLVGAFNRREQFAALSPNTVALIDRDAFSEQWGDLATQEIVSEGISLKKSQMGLLQDFLTQDKFPIREELREKISRLSKCSEERELETTDIFRGTLFGYQKEGLDWLKFLEEGEFGGLLADEMGLGKTVQVLAFFSLLKVDKPCLVVMPTSLLFNWQRELKKFLPSFAVYRHEGKERLQSSEELQQKQIILTSYSLLRIDKELLQSVEYQVIVIDEAQGIKNQDSQISQICCMLKAKIRLAITGTPIENRLEDLWSIFRFLQPDLLGERGQFLAEMQAAQLNAQYFARVKKKIRPFILRRKKEQVSLQLPPKLEQTVFVEMTTEQREMYDRWLSGTKQGLLKKVTLDGAASHRMEILEAILRLRQLCAHPWLVEKEGAGEAQQMSAKFERMLSDLQEVVQEKQKVLIYSQFTSMLKIMESEIKQLGYKYVYLDGSTKDREKIVQQFQEDPETLIFLISLKAGGVGLNLTAADYVFLYDPWWNDAVERQAIDRAHRFGKVGTVIARRYVTALSIEEKIMRLKEHKTALSEQLLDTGEGFDPVSLDDLLELLT